MFSLKQSRNRPKGTKQSVLSSPPPVGNGLRSEHADESCLAFAAAENQHERVDGFRRAWSQPEIRWKMGNA